MKRNGAMNEKRKVLVIGLDGMTATSMTPMVEAGVMPVMKCSVG